MRCRQCGERFAANHRIDYGPGGTERPGVFCLMTVALVAVGAGLKAAGVVSWAWVLLCIAALTALACASSWIGCSDRSACPRCKEPTRVWPWSF
jgi:hypothetical protein